MKTSDTKGTRRRQVPRRPYVTAVGVLFQGEYQIEQTYQVSEGGMMIGSSRELKEGDLTVVTFRVPSSPFLIVRGIIRSVVPAKGDLPQRYGMEFQTLEFSAKREIRNYVAAATKEETASTVY